MFTKIGNMEKKEKQIVYVGRDSYEKGTDILRGIESKINGKVVFSKYHPGKYLVAWHPKSSEENERTTVVVKNESVGEILYRQIAGALAKRIVNYAKEGQEVVQGSDSGFIKFGSRVDVFLPIGTKLEVELNQKVKGGLTVIAKV